MPGIVELTQSITRLPVRIGIPPTLNGVSNTLLTDPAYATSVGLILWKMKNDSSGSGSQKWVSTKPAGFRGLLSSLMKFFR
jgi:cell division ATPase FtsA